MQQRARIVRLADAEIGEVELGSTLPAVHTEAPLRFSAGRPFQLSPPARQVAQWCETATLPSGLRIESDDEVAAGDCPAIALHYFALRHQRAAGNLLALLVIRDRLESQMTAARFHVERDHVIVRSGDEELVAIHREVALHGDLVSVGSCREYCQRKSPVTALSACTLSP